MLQMILYVVIVIPITQLILNYFRKGNKTEKYEDTIKFSKSYAKLFHVLAFITALMGIVLGLRFGWKDSQAHLYLIIGLILLLEIAGLIISRYGIKVSDNGFCVRRVFKYSREIKFHNIDYVQIKNNRDIWLYANQKIAVKINSATIGYKQFLNLIKKNGIEIKNEKV